MMLRLLRGLLRLMLFVAIAGALAAAGRSLVGYISGEPGTSARDGSYDSWPEVPQAPARQGASG